MPMAPRRKLLTDCGREEGCGIERPARTISRIPFSPFFQWQRDGRRCRLDGRRQLRHHWYVSRRQKSCANAAVPFMPPPT